MTVWFREMEVEFLSDVLESVADLILIVADFLMPM